MITFIRKIYEVIGVLPRNRAELDEKLAEAKEDDLISISELVMIRGVLALFDQRVKDVQIPTGKVVWLHLGDSLTEIIEEIKKSGHSRYPVLDDETEKVVGIMHVKHLLRIANSEPYYKLEKSLLQKVRQVPHSKRLDSMLRNFQKHHVHMAIVADEYGNSTGVITLEDVLEKIVGSIRDEFDQHEKDDNEEPLVISAEHDKKWRIRGDASPDKFNKKFNTSMNTEQFKTVGGWFAREFGRIPKTGNSLSFENYLITVAQTDDKRVRSFDVVDTDKDTQPLDGK